jgi:hypothetical protein
MPFDPIGSAPLDLLVSIVHPQRTHEQGAETDIGKLSLFKLDEHHHVVEFRTQSAVEIDARRKRHFETQSSQQGGERTVQFVAKPAPPLLDDLFKEFFLIKSNSTSEMNIEVLKRDRHHVRAVELTQRFRSRNPGPGVLDAFKVSVCVHALLCRGILDCRIQDSRYYLSQYHLCDIYSLLSLQALFVRSRK